MERRSYTDLHRRWPKAWRRDTATLPFFMPERRNYHDVLYALELNLFRLARRPRLEFARAASVLFTDRVISGFPSFSPVFQA